VQQILALVMQESDMIISDWDKWIGSVPAFAELRDGRASVILSFLVSAKYLCEDNGILHIGPETENRLGRRNFMELLSVIDSQPLFEVRYGRHEVGYVHPLSFTARTKFQPILALGGHGWRVTHLDWNRKVAYVEPSDELGRSRWLGSSIPLSAIICDTVRKILISNAESPFWSLRAREKVSELRNELSSVAVSDRTTIFQHADYLEWWTFAGLVTNQTIASLLEPFLQEEVQSDNLWIRVRSQRSISDLEITIRHACDAKWPPNPNPMTDKALDLLKFAELLPSKLLDDLVLARMTDIPSARLVLSSNIRVV
jgi:ATP-dependent Lhr-like helicase